jgi:glycosyltransferase involved in cell wall biosynthesis/SAM-dependent methyltransferase
MASFYNTFSSRCPGNAHVTVPSVSVIVCTYNRADSLQVTLESLQSLAYPAFEMIVVAGPSTDHTSGVLALYDGMVKLVPTAERNLSTARNLGIAAAAGQIVAFLDDDAVPDGAWLSDLVPVFDDPEVAATGGPVFDHTGYQLQARFSLADRWGDARIELDSKRLAFLDHPDTWSFPYTIGTNALFRRQQVVALGGFDENYAFYLDETDLCLRLITSGYRVVPQERGLVHHKFLPSVIRNEARVTVDRFNVVLSRAYFAIRHGLPRSDAVAMWTALTQFVKVQRVDLAAHVDAGRASSEALEQFDLDVVRAWELAQDRAGEPALTRPPDWFDAQPAEFLTFQTKQPSGRQLRICIVTHGYPPGAVPGIGRACHTLAVGLASAGHLVHVITASTIGHSTVDFEDGVWVHRITSTDHGPPPIPALPQIRWDRAGSVLDEIRRLDAFTPVDLVHVPNWDAEGLAVIRDGRYRTCLFVHTPVLAVAEHDTRLDPADPAIAALAEAERSSYESADIVMASFSATFEHLRRLYGVQISAWKSVAVPIALPDVPSPVEQVQADVVEILFVGRLEPRKGIDTLLAAVPELCARYPSVRFTLVGDDSIVAPDGLTYREAFEATQPSAVLERVRFTGPLPDEELAAAMARCQIFVAPSRFESFGLVNLEAMRSGKPVVSTLVNGVSSVIRDGEDGILVPPDNPVALGAALARLIDDPGLRFTLGASGRRSFQATFNVERMVDGVVASFQALLHGQPQPSAPRIIDPTPPGNPHPLTQVAAERQARLLEALRCPRCRHPLQLKAEVCTSEGRIKTGTLLCRPCRRTTAAIRTFQVVFREVEEIQERPTEGAARVIGDLGEHRVSPAHGRVSGAGWISYPDCWIGDKVGATLILRAPCTDIRARFIDHEAGGVVKVAVDGAVVDVIDTRDAPGTSVSRIVDLATDLEMASHEVVFTVRDVDPDHRVVIQELVLLGPRQAGLPFAPPAPFVRANPYSDRILDGLRQCAPSQLILECGGGDRRPDRPNHINLEFLPYEGADLRADTHRLPFEDDTFAIVLNQAVLEHVADPVSATQEMIRVCKPGGLILTEVAFMQPLHGVPYHFYNMTQWGVEELFKEACTIQESDWFGDLSFTMDWLLDAAGVTAKLDRADREDWRRRFATLDPLVDHASLRAVASGIWLVAKKR